MALRVPLERGQHALAFSLAALLLLGVSCVSQGQSRAPGSGAAGGAAGGAGIAAGGTPALDASTVAGSGGAAGSVAADASADNAGGSSGAAGSGAALDAGTTDASRSNKVLIYGVTAAPSYRHDSIPAAAAAIAQAAAAAGLTTEVVGASNATNVVDATKFTAAALAEYGAVILLANDGEPFGYPATQEIQNLVDYVLGGGALIGIECATDCYGGAFSGPMDGHPMSMPFHTLLGGTMNGHSNFAPAKCTKMGTHPSVTSLAPTFNLTDEIYAFSYFRMDNQVVLTCVSSTDLNSVRPISWVREEGSGRVFYTALGHPAASWTAPMDPNAESRLVDDHVLPGLLWAMRR